MSDISNNIIEVINQGKEVVGDSVEIISAVEDMKKGGNIIKDVGTITNDSIHLFHLFSELKDELQMDYEAFSKQFNNFITFINPKKKV